MVLQNSGKGLQYKSGSRIWVHTVFHFCIENLYQMQNVVIEFVLYFQGLKMFLVFSVANIV